MWRGSPGVTERIWTIASFFAIKIDFRDSQDKDHEYNVILTPHCVFVFVSSLIRAGDMSWPN